MTMIAPAIQEFFTGYLVNQRRLSPHTITTYRDTWKLLLAFAANRHATPAHQLELNHIDAPTVIAFLDHLETQRRNAIPTRNARLAGINTLVARAGRAHPEYLNTAAQIVAIPTKKADEPTRTVLTGIELQTILDAPADTWTGRRDKAMLALAAQTGLRVAELAALTLDDVHTHPPVHVACRGKGRKQRITPFTTDLARHLEQYIAERRARPGLALFPNPQGNHLSTDAIRRRLAVHVATAATRHPALAAKNITPHTLRHTAATNFLKAGIDISVIALWLGHENIASTSIYLQADLTLKQAALDRTRQPDTPPGHYQPPDPLLAWLDQLSNAEQSATHKPPTSTPAQTST